VQRRAAAQSKQRRNWELRGQVITLLGSKCTVCGIPDRRVLQVDHIQPVHRVERHGYQVRDYKRIISGEETNVQLLCANCHMIKTAEDFSHYSTLRDGLVVKATGS
jgi:predicted HNH restriction endonuclease